MALTVFLLTNPIFLGLFVALIFWWFFASGYSRNLLKRGMNDVLQRFKPVRRTINITLLLATCAGAIFSIISFLNQ